MAVPAFTKEGFWWARWRAQGDAAVLEPVHVYAKVESPERSEDWSVLMFGVDFSMAPTEFEWGAEIAR